MASKVYYNENDKFAVKWLKEMIAAKLIPYGEVDDRSILEVKTDDLSGFNQCHFFAGIAGWAYALQLAGWPEDREVWTGSCPCQPFSVAGKGKGTADERHLWPAFRQLISERKPATCFGEQVASKAGRLWLAGVRSDLEDMGYAVGAADLCAAGIGAPHIRQRLYWVADAQKRNGAFGNIYRGSYPQGVESFSEFRNCHTTQVWDGLFWPINISIVCVEPDGFSNRVGILRGAGNAIVPQVAAEFIRAFMEVRDGQ